jgi:hypothetical protein
MRHSPFATVLILHLAASTFGSAATAADPVKTAGGKQPASAAEGLPRFPPPNTYPKPTEAERRIAVALEQPIDVNWVDVQLGDIAVEIENKYDLPVELDLASLTADGKGPETLINKSLRNVQLKNLLRSILDEQNLTYVVRYDQLLITTKFAADALTSLRVYQVHDLVVAANDPSAARPDFEHLIELITSTIEPETWREAGGTQGEVKQFYGPGVLTLIVTQTEKVHKQVEELLAALRAAQAAPIREAQARLPRPTPPPADAPFGVGADVPPEKPQWKPVPASGAEVLARFPPAGIYPEPTDVERRIQAALATTTDVAWLDTELNVVAQELAEKFKIPFRIKGSRSATSSNRPSRKMSWRSASTKGPS